MIKNMPVSLKINQTLSGEKLALAIIITCTMITCFGCRNQGGGQGQQGAAPVAQPYPVFKATTHNTTLQTEYPATLQGQQNIEIRPKIDGYVEHIYIDEGATVKK